MALQFVLAPAKPVEKDLIDLFYDKFKPKGNPKSNPIGLLVIGGHTQTTRTGVILGANRSYDFNSIKGSGPFEYRLAKQGIGPRRCWFSKFARVWVVGCQTAERICNLFSKLFLRKGAECIGTKRDLFGFFYPTSIDRRIFNRDFRRSWHLSERTPQIIIRNLRSIFIKPNPSFNNFSNLRDAKALWKTVPGKN